MKTNRYLEWGTALLLACGRASAQVPSEVERLQQELKQSNENLEKALSEHQQRIEDLQRQLDALREGRGDAPEAGVTNRVAEPGIGPAAPEVATTKPAWSPASPMSVWSRGNNYLNLSFNGLFAAGGATDSDIEGTLELGAHDPNQRGFTVQNLEMTLEGMIDPYFRGQASVIYQIDRDGESGLEVEEAYMETLSMPWNLQAKGGQYFTDFGRLNPTHPHTWDFVDQPLVNGRLLGGDGLRNPGIEWAWLAPVPIYSELSVSVQNSQGETASSFRNDHEDEIYSGRLHEVDDVHSAGDLLFAPRYAGSVDLSDTQVALWGVSAAFGPNASGSDTRTEIYGVDWTWKWKPVSHHGGFPFLKWQTEVMWRRYEAGAFNWGTDGDGSVTDPVTGAPAVLGEETLEDYGFYTQLVYGFRKGWLAGLRFDYVTSKDANYESPGLVIDGELQTRDPDRATRWRISPDLTWHPTEYSKLRLQYNYDDRKGIGEDHSVWLQFEFVLGAHAAHTF